LEICNRNKILFVNAAVEEWEPYGKHDTYHKTLYYRQMKIRQWMTDANIAPNSTTAVLDHGANPG
jgi:homospermidine synthase